MSINNFEILGKKKIRWECCGKKIILKFEFPVEAYLVKHRDEVIVIADPREVGINNIFVYSEDGSVRLRPKMPELGKPASGVYSLIFQPNKDSFEVILDSDEYEPYDTGCMFDLDSGLFYDCHPSK